MPEVLKYCNPFLKSPVLTYTIFVFMDCLDNRGPAVMRGLFFYLAYPFGMGIKCFISIMPLNPGDIAPLFTLYDSDKHPVALQKFAGKHNVLLLFFPLAFTSTCTTELCAVRDDLHQYQKLNCEVLGISVDSVYTLAKYKEAQNLNYLLLSDFNKKVSHMYKTIYDTFGMMEMIGVSKRSAFLIDSKGIIRYSEVLDNASEVPDFKRINETLSVLT